MLITNVKKYKFYSKVTYLDKVYNIENEILIKYQLDTGKHFNEETFNEIYKESVYYYYNRIALNKLKRMLTKTEVIIFLKENEAPDEIIKSLINKYIKNGYINDEYYTRFYIESRYFREGPKQILKKLLEKGIDKDLIESVLETFDESESIKEYIYRRVKKIKNKTEKQVIAQLKRELITKGYSFDLSNKLVNDLILDFEFNDKSLIDKEFNKLFKRHSKKKEAHELKYYIKNNLYQKGFNKNLIDEVFNKNDNLF